MTGNEIVIAQASGEFRSYHLTRFDRTNQNTILDQRPSVIAGQRVEAGQIIANGPAIDNGELAMDAGSAHCLLALGWTEL